jgi:hypothetical protein
MMDSYRALRRILPTIKRNSGTDNVFTATMFEELITTAAIIRDKTRLG